MGLKKLDTLEETADSIITLLVEGNIEQATAILQGQKDSIKEEKRQIAGDGSDIYNYQCIGCSVICPASFKFKPDKEYLKLCPLDCEKVAKFEEISVGSQS